MVVDGTRIPAPAPSRSRLARPSQKSRLPTRPTNLTPRRSSLAKDKSKLPRTPTGLRGPRRQSREPATPDSQGRATTNPSDRPDPKTRTPRRVGNVPRVGMLSEERKTPRGSTIPAPRRVSKEPNRVGVPRFVSRLSGNSQEPPATRARVTRNDSNIPDRGTSSLAQPSPRRGSATKPRPGLSPSPYARRTSSGTNARAKASGTTPRRLNMGKDEESRGVSNMASRRISGAADRMEDRVEPRRDSVGGNPRRMSALESFRARRKSLEASKKLEEDQKQLLQSQQSTDQDVVMATSSAEQPMAIATTSGTSPLRSQTLPDRPDPLTPGLALGAEDSITPGRKKRKSTRFSEANICLDAVEQLNKSLGKRRSIPMGEPLPEETPTLRRSSLKRRMDEKFAMERREKEAAAAKAAGRLPLASLETGNENTQSQDGDVTMKTERRTSFVPTIEGDEFGWEDDVEDLGAE